MNLQEQDVDDLIASLRALPVNCNRFYVRFRAGGLSFEQLRTFAGPYYWMCIQYEGRLLPGLIARVPIAEDAIRLELVRTLYSELGACDPHRVHAALFAKFMRAIGCTDAAIADAAPISAVAAYVEQLDDVFRRGSFTTALGAALGVEVTSATEFEYLTPGALTYRPTLGDDALEYFTLHAIEEEHHSDWLAAAARAAARSPTDILELREGAMLAARLWTDFWEDMYTHVFGATL